MENAGKSVPAPEDIDQDPPSLYSIANGIIFTIFLLFVYGISHLVIEFSGSSLLMSDRSTFLYYFWFLGTLMMLVYDPNKQEAMLTKMYGMVKNAIPFASQIPGI